MSCKMQNYHSVFRVAVSLLLFESLVRTVNCNRNLPEFTEPIKNITISVGSNVELSCYVKHLGSYRVMWMKKEADKEIFVAINLLKITKNPRVTISLLQTSDDVTQSNVYIHNGEKEDSGGYECAVNTNPMISQIGTLEVTTHEDRPVPQFNPIAEPEEVPGRNGHYSENSTTFEVDSALEVDNITESIGPGNNNVTLCSDMKTFWEDATDSIKELVKNAFQSLVNFTCSFLAINA